MELTLRFSVKMFSGSHVCSTNTRTRKYLREIWSSTEFTASQCDAVKQSVFDIKRGGKWSGLRTARAIAFFCEVVHTNFGNKVHDGMLACFDVILWMLSENDNMDYIYCSERAPNQYSRGIYKKTTVLYFAAAVQRRWAIARPFSQSACSSKLAACADLL